MKPDFRHWGGALKDKTERAKVFLSSGSPMAKIILAILILLVFLIIMHIIKGIYTRMTQYRDSYYWLNGGDSFCPKSGQSFPGKYFHRSKNELGGAEFTLAFWMHINDFSFKYGAWKHVMHKGNDNSWPNRAPGIWLHPKQNSMRFYMNTYNSIAGNYIDIDNIPVHKWFHITVSVNQLSMDVYVNGNMRKSIKFSSLPKQNFGDFYVMNNRGFDGYLSRVIYYNYTIPYSEIEKLIMQGPGSIDCGKNLDVPPYLSPGFWTAQ